jgi:hypothetical protein
MNFIEIGVERFWGHNDIVILDLVAALDCSSSSAQLVIREEDRQLQQPQARLDGPMVVVLLVCSSGTLFFQDRALHVLH